jgi:hypothetical protein
VRFENFLPCPSSIAAFSCHITSASFLKIILFSYDSFCRCKNEAKTAQIFERQISRFLSRCSLNPLFLASLIAHSFSLTPWHEKPPQPRASRQIWEDEPGLSKPALEFD